MKFDGYSLVFQDMTNHDRIIEGQVLIPGKAGTLREVVHQLDEEDFKEDRVVEVLPCQMLVH